MEIKQVDKKINQLANAVDQLNLINRYIECVQMAKQRKDELSLQYFLKSNGLRDISDNVEGVKENVQEVADELCDIAEEEEDNAK
ncbi:hypothetical protein TMUPMC115_2062 [Tetragenococcus muriaticus PMC-11-5]|uniref:Uncharacterized protein n=2 Tax=Tetragenococcus muriaticus TaxID=64642 RepID=A0A091C217_9ENTE|nr:hypothetical protein TMUPMC115_2062 [Tetragenococcus muriaticus PMC-11-5]